MTIDFDEITTTEPPPRRTGRRIAAGVGAAMLVAAAGGVGFGIGRNVDRDQSDLTAGPAAQPSDELDTVPPITEPATSEPDAPAPTTAEQEVPAGTAGDERDDLADETDGQAEQAPVAESVDAAPSGGPGYTVFGGQTSERLFDRTTDDGLTVRVHLGEVWDTEGYYDDGTGWQPPAWCEESGQVRLAIGNSTVIDVGSAPWYTEPYQGRSVSWLTLGRADEVPHRVVFAQVPDGTTNVSVTHGDGATDGAAPQNGVVALVVPGAPESVVHDDDGYVWFEETADFDITFESADGNADITFESEAVGTRGDPAFVASCAPPPPALPDPGEQPADPAADEATVTQLMADIYGDDQGESFETLDWIDDPTGVAEAREQVRQGGFADAAATAEATVEELVFTAPDEAWFRYRLDTSVTLLTERFGIARLVDGSWKITRDTVCQDLSLASGDCGAGWTSVFPPGY